MSAGEAIIIAVTDSPHLRVLLEEGFRAHAVAAPLFFAAGQAADGAPWSSAVLAIGDGSAACAALAKQGASCPVIAILEKGEAHPALPARDVFFRPFRLGILLARALAHCDGRAAAQQSALSIGPFRLDMATGMLERDGAAAAELTEKERSILLLLHRRGGGTVSRKELLEQVWGYGDGIDTHTLETHIYRLRQKIEADPAHPQLLVTDGAGYRLDQVF